MQGAVWQAILNAQLRPCHLIGFHYIAALLAMTMATLAVAMTQVAAVARALALALALAAAASAASCLDSEPAVEGPECMPC